MAGNLVGLNFRYQALKAYFRGIIFVPEHFIIVAYYLAFRGLFFRFGLSVMKITNENFPLNITVFTILFVVNTVHKSYNICINTKLAELRDIQIVGGKEVPTIPATKPKYNVGRNIPSYCDYARTHAQTHSNGGRGL